MEIKIKSGSKRLYEKYQTLKNRIEVLEQVVASMEYSCYFINLTKDMIPGIMYHTSNGVKCNVNEQMGFPENAKISEVVSYLGNMLPEEEKQDYFSTFHVPNMLERFAAGEKQITHRYWAYAANGKRIYVERHVDMFQDEESGDIVAYSYVCNLTGQFEAEVYKKEANDANREKTEFISQIAHDIRTPMNSLFGFLDIAENNIGNDEKVRYSLDKIRVAGKFLKDLVNDVLDISRMESGKLNIVPEKVSIQKLLEEFWVYKEVSVSGKKIDFQCHVHDIRHDTLFIDPLRLKQIYTNVVSNAIKYTLDGGRVTLEVYEEEISDSKNIRLVSIISDNGIGMSKEFMKKMFQKFEREQDTRINKVSGHGLGLAIVKQLVDLLNGTIEVKSEVGKGTVFCIKLEVPYVEEKKATEETEVMDYGRLCTGMHLLIAEDNALNREVITELLNMYHISCECVEDGAICVKRYKEAEAGTFDAILMDMQMPNMDGLTAARNIRKMELAGTYAIPIIAMSANALKEDIQKCLDSGMNEHLSKPVDMEKMLQVLAKVRKPPIFVT